MCICLNCGKEHDGTYGSGKFCSSSCARTRHHSIEVKQKISNTLKSKDSRASQARLYNYCSPEEVPGLKLSVNTCQVCGKEFYHLKASVKTCSPKCYNSLRDSINEKQRNKTRVRYKVDGQWNDLATQSIYKWYYTYRITNLINNKYYLGIHMTNNLDDGYMGSGKAITSAIRKYGKENFKKEILNYYKCYKELAEAERALITERELCDENCYNLTLGGVGGPAFLGHHHSDETKQKLSNIQRGKKHSLETRLRISESQKGRKAWNKGLKLRKD